MPKIYAVRPVTTVEIGVSGVVRPVATSACRKFRAFRDSTFKRYGRIRSVLKEVARHKGKIAAIEPESGDFFLGASLLKALNRGRERSPAGVFYFVRVGYPTLHVHHGEPRRVSP